MIPGHVIARAARALAAVAALLGAAACVAADPARTDVSEAYRGLAIHQYHHTAWTVRQGAPGQITALAQDTGGFLWLATQTGLFRFDGVTFERIAPEGDDAFPTDSVAALFAPRTGGVWVGLRYGAVSFVGPDAVRHFDGDDGVPTGSVYGFAQDGDGTVWAATFQGLARFDGQRWHALDASWALPGRQARSVFVDRDGRLWVATDAALAYLPAGARAFVRLDVDVGRISQITQAPDGAIWIAEADGGVRAVWRDGSVVVDRPQLPSPSAGLLFDRHGSLWATSLGEGIHRIAHPERAGAPAVQRFRENDGLTSDYLWPALEDREGNLWFGTSRGLDRFRRSNVVQATVPDGAYDFAIAAGDGGSLWAGTKNRPLMQLQGDAVHMGSAPVGITAALRTDGGTLLFGGPDGLWQLRDDGIVPLAPLPPQVRYSGVQAMARAADGTVWVSLNQPGVFQWRDDTWSHLREVPAFPTGSSPLTLLADRDGTMWLGFARNRLVRMRGTDATPFDSEDGLAVGNVSALARGAQVLWIGGERGLAFHDGSRIHAVPAAGDDLLRGLSGIVETADGELWLNGARGVLRVAARDVARMLDAARRAQPVPLPSLERFDFLDGLPGTPAQFRPLPTAVQGTDGRLWFATTSGVVWIDPRTILRNPLPPPVTVRAVFADGHRHDPRFALRLPADTARLEIDYTALSLSVPERVRFRYRLDGIDTAWQDVGDRRRAFYTNPGPGEYVFRVHAANDDGVWNDTGATLALSVAPHFYQSTWFALLCALAVIVLLRLFHRRRMAQLAAGMRARMQERHDERERIARELHDTLLQGFQGLILRFQGVADRLPADDPLRETMERALDRAEGVLVEGRDRVRELRAADGETSDLRAALLRLGQDLEADSPTRFRVAVVGRAEPLAPLVREEIYCIVREAIFNAFQHANARLVEVEVSYARSELRVSVRDDGRGVDPAFLGPGGRPGHWGLAGMRERAQRIGASVEVLSKPGVGTDVLLRMPRALAFRDTGAGSLRARVVARVKAFLGAGPKKTDRARTAGTRR